jgi:Rrf2 family protein
MFSKETEYALRALVYIQEQNLGGRRPGTDEIAREIEAPRFFTAKILQRLVRHGFIMSLKGKGGGFFFDREKPELSIRQLITITESNRDFTCCGFGLKECNASSPCPLHRHYVPIREALENLVSTQTIQSLAKNKTRIKSEK